MTYTPSQQTLINNVNNRIAEGLLLRKVDLNEVGVLLRYSGRGWDIIGPRGPGRSLEFQENQVVVFAPEADVRQILPALKEPPDVSSMFALSKARIPGRPGRAR